MMPLTERKSRTVEREIWNFAYGGNMNPGVLIDRRGIEPRESTAGRLEGYRLAFTAPGLPWVEPAFANIEPAPGDAVHGVLHRLTTRQLRRLDLFEGGGLAYRHLDLQVSAYDGRNIRARVYSSIRVSAEKAPSCRYLNILREGARHHGLHPDYVRMLDEHPCGSEFQVPDALFTRVEGLLRQGKPVISFLQAFQRFVCSVVKTPFQRPRRR
jgi:hypothetical protein